MLATVVFKPQTFSDGCLNVGAETIDFEISARGGTFQPVGPDAGKRELEYSLKYLSAFFLGLVNSLFLLSSERNVPVGFLEIEAGLPEPSKLMLLLLSGDQTVDNGDNNDKNGDRIKINPTPFPSHLYYS